MRATVITAACLFLLAGASAQQGKPKASTVPSGKAVLEAYVSAWNRHDFAALDKLLTPDAVHEDIAWPSRDEGPAQIKEFMRQMIEAEPDFDWRLTTIVDGGSVVAAEWTWTATYTGDSPIGHVVGFHGSGRGASVAVIENGRIKRFTDYYDFASFFPKVPDGSATTSKMNRPSQGVATGPSDEKALLEIDHASGAAQQKQASAPTSLPPAHEMQRLTNMLAGRWSIGQIFEPRSGMPKGAVGQGTEVWRPGPGGLSLIEEFQSRDGDRDFSGLGVIWRDTQAQGYRVIWCGSANPRGCVVMSKLAHWENDQFVVGDEFERDGKKVVYREVFSDFTPNSFTQTIYEGESGGELKRKLTIHATKVSESSKSSAANATPPDDDLSTAKQQVLDLGKEWAAAEDKRDTSTLRRILDDKFVASFGAKKPYDKEAFIKQIVGGDVDPTESQTLTDETVTIDHDTAVVVGTDTVRGTEGGAAYTVVYRYTVTYIRRHGQWLALAEHLVEVPQSK